MKPKRATKGRNNQGGKGILRKIALTAAALFVLVVFMAAAALAALWFMDRAPANAVSGQEALFTIARGEQGLSVTRRLVQGGYIRSELVFRSLMKLKNYDLALKAGTYRIAAEMPGSEILEMFVSGKQVLESVRVPEGTSLASLAKIVEASGVASAQAFLSAAKDGPFLKTLGLVSDSAEGYLFPETYFFARDSEAEELVRVMVKTFFSRLEGSLPEYSALSPQELFEKVKLASVIEREYRVPEEAARMAGVFYNRLKIGMPLQSCATVVYVITEKLGKPHPSRLFDRDLQLDSPYNTYLHRGLPPAPICSPGMTALSAALRPEPTKYLYFRLVDEASGKHYFSETLDEHIKASSLFVKQ